MFKCKFNLYHFSYRRKCYDICHLADIGRWYNLVNKLDMYQTGWVFVIVCSKEITRISWFGLSQKIENQFLLRFYRVQQTQDTKWMTMLLKWFTKCREISQTHSGLFTAWFAEVRHQLFSDNLVVNQECQTNACDLDFGLSCVANVVNSSNEHFVKWALHRCQQWVLSELILPKYVHRLYEPPNSILVL